MSIESAEKEYYFLQNEVGRYDTLSHSIKNWSITVGFALLAAGFTQKTPSLFPIASVASVLFWFTDARWKRYQTFHLKRLIVVEEFLRGDISAYDGPMISANMKSCFSEYYQGSIRGQIKVIIDELKLMSVTNVRQPHNFIFLSGFLSYVYSNWDHSWRFLIKTMT